MMRSRQSRQGAAKSTAMKHDAYETKYVAVGDTDVAYKVIGQGPMDVLRFYGVGSQVDAIWDYPTVVQVLDALSAFSRIIVFDRRGTGASDRLPRDAIPTWEECTQDVTAVLDAVGSDRVAIHTQLDAGPIALLFRGHASGAGAGACLDEHHRALPGRRRLSDRCVSSDPRRRD